MKPLLILFLLVAAWPARAATLTLTVGDLTEAIEQAEGEPDALQRWLLDDIGQRLEAADLRLQGGQLVYRDSIVDRTLDDGCNSTVIRRLDTDVTLLGDTALTITLDSLLDPIVVKLNVAARVNATGRVRQTFGVRLFGCNEIGRDTFDVSARGPLSLNLEAQLALNPERVSERLLRLQPTIEVQGELERSDVRVDVDDTIVRRVIEEFLQDELDDAFSPERVQKELAALQAQLAEQLDSDGEGAGIDIELPDPSDEQIIALLELLDPEADFTLTLDHLLRNRYELLAALLLGDTDRITDLLSAAAACTAATALQVALPQPPLYSLSEGSCALADANEADQIFFADSNCQQALDFAPTSFGDFCATVLDDQRLGNAADSMQALGQWSLSPGTRFDLGVLGITGKIQPLVRRERYKQVQTPAGLCELEMRIYTGGPLVTGQKPLLALHGGSWQHRQSGFLGIEAMATQFVDEGFVVFAPFYRLIGSDDGNVECHNAATRDLLIDANDALDWVQAQAGRYGASGKVHLFGQSAGGHLAASLAVYRPADIDRTVLFYAPVDFVDFTEQLQLGLYEGTRGERILTAVTGAELSTLALDTPLLLENSFPSLISSDPAAVPPFFLLHGEADTLLPFRQSVRLCNALSGNPAEGPASLEHNLTDYRRIIACDSRGSELHLLAEGDHALDFCVADGLCLAGSPESAAQASQSVQRMLEWLSVPFEPMDDAPSGIAQGSVASSSAGQAGWPSLLGLLAIGLLRRLAQRPPRSGARLY